MGSERRTNQRDFILGIECGATRTVAICADGNLRLIQRKEGGPANLRLLNDAQLVQHFRGIAAEIPRPVALCIGMAGARTPSDFRRIRVAADAVWKGVPCHATNDLETALLAAEPPGSRVEATVLVLSGTGSCCFGRTENGRSAKVGGWGHILGDKGSAYEIGLRALKAVVFYFDRDGNWPRLGTNLLRALQLNEPNDLITWIQSAPKPDIAALAKEVFKAANTGDRIARDILKGASHILAVDAAACAARLVKKSSGVHFVFAGGVLINNDRFRRAVETELRGLWPKCVFSVLRRESAWGAVELARREGMRKESGGRDQGSGGRSQESGDRAGATARARARAREREAGGGGAAIDLISLKQSPTEQRNPRSMKLDQLRVGNAIKLMLKEDAQIPAAILKEAPAIEKTISLIVRAFRSGGRLFYVGAGTSGRLGVLDASECPPTFQSPPEMVQAIMAGGQRALWEAVEGAEDDPEAGARAVELRGVRAGDVVVGIAASGRTPFVWGALRAAKRRGAKTVLLTFNPFLQIRRQDKPTVVVAPNVGPEILTGSTRLKAGTATKLILNMFTTLAMVGIGKVLGNLMIDVKASNTKLRDRAVRIVQQLTGAEYESARTALESCDWQIRNACMHLVHSKI